MALDLNIALDDGDEHAIPNLNEAVAEETAAADQEDDQVGGDLHGGANRELPGGDFQGGANHVLPFDLNLHASDQRRNTSRALAKLCGFGCPMANNEAHK
ncbi:hypothetical protein OsJ_12321 [Oryza sativa Japonica Group]|uniref:Uncharacterized protein n=2 Tax=Oryza TaxID=4527 RepID=B9FB60_ORYSJ|nr:hypothetical protein OsJ_12321 [Oryza sativa Japonica Group]